MKAELTQSLDQRLELSHLCLAATEHAPLPMAVVDGATHIVRYANPAFCGLMEKPLEYLVGKSFHDLAPANDVCVKLLDHVLETGKSEVHTEKEGNDSKPVFWSYMMWPVLAEEPLVGVMIQVTESAKLHSQTVAMNEALILGSVRQHELTDAAEVLNAQLQVEISEREKAAQELSKRARELAEKARLLDLSNDAIMVRDFDGHILYWNRGAQELYGWSREEAMGKDIHSLLQSEFPIPQEKIAKELSVSGHWSGELVQVKRDGQRITVLTRKALDHDNEGNPAAVLESITNITESVRSREELKAAKAALTSQASHLEQLVAERTAALTSTNKQMEAFVYSIAHDLRAPLRSMQGFSTLLVEDEETVLSKAGKDFAGRIIKSAQQMDRLLNDLLAFSRIAQLNIELTPVDLDEVIATVVASLESQIEEKAARVESPGPWPRVCAHEPTLIQILINLVSNALKFTAPDVPPLLRLWTEEKGGFIRVWVEDNGIGISPDHQHQIFKLFTRVHGEQYPGTGVGLAIVEKGIERMGGRTGVESAAGSGARFWFELRKAN
ncbi:MAG: ATP-binding protein [Limisphaerales bacterium]